MLAGWAFGRVCIFRSSQLARHSKFPHSAAKKVRACIGRVASLDVFQLFSYVDANLSVRVGLS